YPLFFLPVHEVSCSLFCEFGNDMSNHRSAASEKIQFLQYLPKQAAVQDLSWSIPLIQHVLEMSKDPCSSPPLQRHSINSSANYQLSLRHTHDFQSTSA